MFLAEGLFAVGYLVRVVSRRPEVRLIAGILLLWAIHRLIFFTVAFARSVGLFNLSDMAMTRWIIVLVVQFTSTLMGVGACYLWTLYTRWTTKHLR